VFLSHLECTACGLRHEWQHLQNLCTSCRKPLFAIVDLAAAGRTLKREALATREKSLWRYREVLPLPDGFEPVSLGEGGTPLLRAARFGGAVGLSQLWVKDESQNPTQSFKARGMSVAVSMAKHLGATKLAVPSAGNARGALAAYAARAYLEAHIFMPRGEIFFILSLFRLSRRRRLHFNLRFKEFLWERCARLELYRGNV
jgi:threonine synthase